MVIITPFISIEFKQKLKGVTDEEFPDLLGAAAKSQPKPEVFNPYKKNEKPSPEKSHSPVQEEKKKGIEDYSLLEEHMQKNSELFKKHKIDPNRPKNSNNKKKKGANKLKVKKEEFPGLPGS